MKTIIINGANGYVASHFVYKLLAQNYKVIALVRPGANSSPSERMMTTLAEISNGASVNTTRLKVFPYALLGKDFLIASEQLEEMFSDELDYFHCAASLKFDLKSAEEIFETNLGGLENSIRVFSKYAKGYSRFFFISSAYSCGRYPGRFEEKFYPNEGIEHFRNYYEQSKRLAENVVKEHILGHGLNGHIIRLSQVVGNNKTGVTKTDYGIFDFAKRIYSLAFRHPNQTLRVHFDPVASQNLIPIDTLVDYLLQTVEIIYAPAIMNFIAKNQVKNKDIIQCINQLLPIDIVPAKHLVPDQMNALERIISAGMAFTERYTDTNLEFGTSNLDCFISANGQEANENTVCKMLTYFITNLASEQGKRAVVS